MQKLPKKDLGELIRTKLNTLPEIDNQGNNKRVKWQVFTYLVGAVVKNSKNPNMQLLGLLAQSGAKKSFKDFATRKFQDWLDQKLREL